MDRMWIALTLAAVVLFPGMVRTARADTAQVLPKGIARATVNTQLYLPVTEQFDSSGNVEPVAADFNAVLNASVFPALKQLEQALQLPPGFANLGKSVVRFEYQFYEIDTLVAFGITDKLSFGAKIPYWFQKNEVTAHLDTRNATVGKNVAANMLLPLSVPGTVPLTTRDIKDLLGRGLDINKDGIIDIPGFRYKRFTSWSEEGLADMEAGFKYRYFENPSWRLAASIGARLPTGDVDVTDDLVDYGFGSGAWGVLFALYTDYTGIRNLTLNGTFRYNLILPEEETLRIQRTADEPITANKETVDRDIGDVFEFELEGTYKLVKGLDFSLLYKYGFSLEDKVSGEKDFNYQSLMDQTIYREHIGKATLSYSTIPLYQEKSFPIPMAATVSYRNRFAGENVLKSQYIGLGLSVFF